MSAPSAIPIFAGDYLADTQHMTLEEQGAYMRLLLCAWRSPACELPSDDKRIATMLGVTAGKWGKLKPVILALWTATETGWQHDRLSKSRQFVEEKREKNTAAANARWNDKPLKNIEVADAPALAPAMPLNLNPEEKKESIQPTMSPNPARASDDAFRKVSAALALKPKHESKDRVTFDRWMNDWIGVDLDRDIITLIRAEIDKPDSEDWSVLSRFDALILNHKARMMAKGSCSKPSAKPPIVDLGDNADGYRRVLPDKVKHYLGKGLEVVPEGDKLLHYCNSAFLQSEIEKDRGQLEKLATNKGWAGIIFQTGARQPGTEGRT